MPPPPDSDEQHIWYLDGSMLDGNWVEYRAAGFAIVIVAPDGGLAAYGMGVPPSWCKTAASAETWALHMALALSPFPPQLRTDCRCLLTIATEGAAQATSAARPLARIWRLIAASLDGHVESIVVGGNLVWMPAHQTLSAIGNKALSNGRLLTGVDWRANRLVDALAKQAAATAQAPRAVRCLLESGQAAVKHAAPLLAVVTHAANNHKVPVQRSDGSWGTKIVRDAQQPACYARNRRKLPKEPKAPAPLPAATKAVRDRDIAGDWLLERPNKRPRKASLRIQARRSAADEFQTRRRVNEIAASAQVSEIRPQAQDRLEQLFSRVRARLAGAA